MERADRIGVDGEARRDWSGRPIPPPRSLPVDDLACRLYSVALLRGEAGCAGGLTEVAELAEYLRGPEPDLPEDEREKRELDLEQRWSRVHDRATRFWKLLGAAQQTGLLAYWRLFFDEWQKLLEEMPTGRPLYLNLTATHQLITDLLEDVDDPGDCWRTVLLPCRDCGVVFEVRRRGGRYRRSCGRCRAPLGIKLLEQAHPRGSGLQHGGLMYPRWHPDSPLARAIPVVSVECAHPECGRSFTTTRSDRDHCDEHSDGAAREARRRTRRRIPAAA